jgi:hypothetical protein
LDILVVCAKYKPVIIGNVAHLYNLKSIGHSEKAALPELIKPDG